MLYRKNIILSFILVCSLLVKAQTIQNAPSTEQLLNAFSFAAKAYNIPLDLLKAISYTETRYSNIVESANDAGIYPLTYGIMGLRNDKRMGHSLLDGAKLINQAPEIVAINPTLNIEAAAALLSSIADSLKIDRSNLNNWRPVIEEYSGIPQKDIQPFFTFDVFKVLYDGTNLKGITITSKPEIKMSQFSEEVNPKKNSKNIQSVDSTNLADYPPAWWYPSPNYTPNAINPLFLVVHDTECNFAIALSTLTDPDNNNNPVSSHYLIRSSDGYMIQLVREHDRAWHVGCWNPYMIGVEHEGYVNQPQYFTDTMYKSSAGLYRHLIETWGVPLDSDHVIGHDEHLYAWWRTYINQNYPYIDPTCNTHTDPGQYWNWTKFFSLIRSDATTPYIAAYSPSIEKDSVWSNASVIINFGIAMDQASTQNAFSISPQVAGKFTWQNYSHTLVFTPTALLSPSTTYSVTISKNANSILGVPLQSALNFSFNTKESAPLDLTNTYPANNSADVSTSLKFIIRFNIPIIYSSLGGRVVIQDSSGNTLTIRDPSYNIINNEGVLTFYPYSALSENSKFKVTLKAGIQSVTGEQLNADTVIHFSTGKSTFVKGTEIEDFESVNHWHDPSYSASTKNVDTSKSKFSIVYGTQVDGTHSGKITYVFNDTAGGLCRVYDDAKPDIYSKTNNMFGMWVFGDASNNFLEYWFYTNTNQDVPVRVDTLNWTGWKFVEIPVNNISTGDLLFNSVVIAQNPSGYDSGAVLIDGIQYRNSSLSEVPNLKSTVPIKFSIEQNYPNPFNPTTIIRYSIPAISKQNVHVQLDIYDVLGDHVSQLVNKDQSAGIYEVKFNGINLPSGIYFYRIQAGSFINTKKLILLK
ncbi:MAG: N-acetylmuramoyl-L-alanine amidase [Ignavibacteriaceae bacterium]